MAIETDFEKFINTITNLLINTEVNYANRSITMNEGFSEIASKIQEVKATGKKVMVIGNGGSAAIASHFHVDLCNYIGVRALYFGDIPLMTALSNDYGYQYAYERSINLWASDGDLLIAISSSGKSENILRAVKSAKDKGAFVVTFTGFKPDNPLRNLGNINFYVNSENYGYVESSHSVLAHYLTDRAGA